MSKFLESQVVDIPWGQGLDEKTGKVARAPGKLDVLTDGRFDKMGTLEIRPGFPALTTDTTDGGAIDAGDRLLSTGDQLLLTGRMRIAEWMPGVTQWQDLDYVPEATITDRSLGVRGQETLLAAVDGCELAGVRLCAYVERNTGHGSAPNVYRLYCRVIDAETGGLYTELEELFVASQEVRAVATATKMFVLCRRIFAGDTAVWAIPFDPSTLTWGAPTQVSVPMDTSPVWDACGAGEHLWVAFSSYDGSPVKTWQGVRVHKHREVDLGFVVKADLDIFPIDTAIAINAVVGSMVYVAWVRDGRDGLYCGSLVEATAAIDASGTLVDSDIFGIAGTALIRNVTVAQGPNIANGCRIAYDLHGEIPAQTRIAGMTHAGALGSQQGLTYRIEILSTMIYRSGRYYFVAYIPDTDTVSEDDLPQNNTQFGAFFVEATEETLVEGVGLPHVRVVARIAMHQCGHLLLGGLPVNLHTRPTAGEYGLVVPMLSNARRAMATTTPDTILQRVTEGGDFYTLSFVDQCMHLPVQAGPQLVMSGGVPVAYDGLRVADLGFHMFPIMSVDGITAESSYLASDTDYTWVAIYEWIDAQGVVQRSCPSVACVWHNDSTSNQFTLRVSYPFSEKSDLENPSFLVRVVIFRALNGVFHEVAALIPAPAVDFPNVAYVEYLDGSHNTDADAVIAANQILYTDGGVLENLPAPCARHIAYHDSRIWVVSADDPSMLWFSKIHVPGEMPGFNENLRLQLPSGEPITGILGWDEKLIIFCESSIWLVFGSGPNDLLQGSQYTDPPRLQNSEIGCIDPRSLVHGPGGVYFQSASGIWLLGPTLEPTFVGRAVVDSLAAHNEIVGASLKDLDHEVIFACKEPDSGASVLLVHNYLIDQWATWAPVNATGSATGYQSITLAPFGSRIVTHLLLDSGVVLHESQSQYTDADASLVDMSLTTGWLHLAGIQGFKRVRQLSILGERLAGSHAFDAAIQYDYDETLPSIQVDTGTVDLTGYAYPGAFAGAVFEMRITGKPSIVCVIATPATEAALLAALNAAFFGVCTWSISAVGGRFLRWTAAAAGQITTSEPGFAVAGLRAAVFGPTYYAYAWSAADIAALRVGAREQIQIHMPHQKCEAIRLKLTVTPSTISSVRLSGLSLELRVQGGQYRHGGARPPAAGV